MSFLRSPYLLPDEVLEPLSALSDFVKNLCANELREDILMEMHHIIPIILCKLGTIFSPAFWNVMEHVPVHLAQEAVLGGPLHYRWMYPCLLYTSDAADE